MQMASIEFARNVLGMKNANSTEFDIETKYPVISLMEEQNEVENLGGTMRLGSYPCVLDKNSKVFKLYGVSEILERHRHRYEFNQQYLPEFEEKGFKVVGKSPDGKYVEVIEIPEHPYFVAAQYHPEFMSRPNKPHPLFTGWVEAMLKQKGIK